MTLNTAPATKQREYLSCADTAKLVRQALKESFPGIKFSVKSSVYSGGASITVRYEDGPAAKLVESVAEQFNGSYFDGMIDYKGSVYATLDGQPVRFGADFVFVERKSSESQVERAIAYLRGKYGEQISAEVTVANYNAGKLYNVFPTGGDWSRDNSAETMIRRALVKISDRAGPAKSATLARVAFAGDDGYGRGTVGPDGQGGESAYKAQMEAQERAAAAEKAARALVSMVVLPAPGSVQ